VGVQNRAFGVRRGGTGVDEVDVDVALFVDLGDLAAHPVRSAATEARLQVRGEQLIKLADL
jgi:hypothetical protein